MAERGEHVHFVWILRTFDENEILNCLSGDSWTDTSFNTSGPFPSHDSPLGNPFYPKLNATYGAKWPVYLTTQYNNSLIETYAFAKDGSVVNSNIDPGRADLIGQVQQQFLPLWGSRNDSTWQPYNTLFAVFIGINDVNIAVSCENDTSTTFEEIMVTYSSLVDQVSRYPPQFQNTIHNSS